MQLFKVSPHEANPSRSYTMCHRTPSPPIFFIEFWGIMNSVSLKCRAPCSVSSDGQMTSFVEAIRPARLVTNQIPCFVCLSPIGWESGRVDIRLPSLIELRAPFSPSIITTRVCQLLLGCNTVSFKELIWLQTAG